jgi:glycosyltransferase involved in cell wall biosynthesis
LNKLSQLDLQGAEFVLFTPNVLEVKKNLPFLCHPSFKLSLVTGIFPKHRKLWLQSPSLARRIKKEKIDLFFASGEYLPVFLSKKIKAVLMIHDLVYKLFPKTVGLDNKIFYHTLFPLCVSRADVLVTVSISSCREIKTFFKKKSDPMVIPNGIDTKKYLPVLPVLKKDYLLFVGTMQPRKNLFRLIRAYASIALQINEKLVIVGAKGWKNSKILDFLEHLDPIIKDRIEFKGYVDSGELVALYQEAKLLTVPSLHEGYGLMIAEALAARTSVLTSRVGGIPEYFDGLVHYCDPEDEADMASQILYLLKNPQIMSKTLDKSLSLLVDFDFEMMAKRFLEFFLTFVHSPKQ